MNYLKLTILFIASLIISFGVQAECPYTIKDAMVMLSIDAKTNLKITSSEMCNQKFYFADRFYDADVELWHSGKLIGKYYSRRVSYDQKNLKLILENSTLLESEVISEIKYDKVKFVMVDLKSRKLSSILGEVRF